MPQSPINIHTIHAVDSPGLPALRVHYPSALDLSLRYESKDRTVLAPIPAGAAWITLGGVRYDLVNFHFHTFSEHRLNGRQFPLEQHFVHSGPNGEALVIGLFITPGGKGGTLQDQVLAAVPEQGGPEIPIPRADLAGGLPDDLSTFRYEGSLTTPPYTEGVSWLVLHSHRPILAASLYRLQLRFPDGDSRMLQPLQGRTVNYRAQH
ncbi:carbonic anhydrase family protein [Kribbella sp. CA-293567]|uniref:carbonic anhydrase family protein n=1 Tax=Kribbella sp. CA-293567 TaxID=3002436 RepID=UPI0022DCFF95|nr:carbonic anhydrase family protein [Kribbella sp. CA-293567]WBQ06571.1 carbonic anhydrase family protein [Kribbella sp. CA-293567]